MIAHRVVFASLALLSTMPAAAHHDDGVAGERWLQACAACHGAAADGDAPIVELGALSPDAVVAALEAFRAGMRPATVMDRIARALTDDDIAAIAAAVARDTASAKAPAESVAPEPR